jgi:hypothetical protein
MLCCLLRLLRCVKGAGSTGASAWRPPPEGSSLAPDTGGAVPGGRVARGVRAVVPPGVAST